MTWEHLQDVWSKVHNRRVREHFRDLISDPDNDEAWENLVGDINISIPRQSLWLACNISDQDTADMTILRTLLFWVVLGQAQALHPPLYTMPIDRYQQEVKFAPQVTLFFKEDLDEVEEGYSPLDAEISFRLMNETSQSLTQADATLLANKIKLEFNGGGGYRWHKGRTKLSYRDKERGYQFSVNAFNETDGKNLINKVLDLQGHTLNSDLLSVSQLDSAPPTVPPMEFVYGKSRRSSRRRPVGWVRFQYADLHIHGIPNAITLIDRTGRRKNPLVQA